MKDKAALLIKEDVGIARVFSITMKHCQSALCTVLLSWLWISQTSVNVYLYVLEPFRLPRFCFFYISKRGLHSCRLQRINNIFWDVLYSSFSFFSLTLHRGEINAYPLWDNSREVFRFTLHHSSHCVKCCEVSVSTLHASKDLSHCHLNVLCEVWGVKSEYWLQIFS